ASGTKFNANLTLAYYRRDTLEQPVINYDLSGIQGSVEANDITNTGVFDLGELVIKIPSVSEPTKMELTISIKDTDIINTYNLWVYPEAPEVPKTSYETMINAAIEK